MRRRAKESGETKLNKRRLELVYSEEQLQAKARKILDGIFLNKQGQWISGHELEEGEQDNLVGHVYIQMVMRIVSQRTGYMDADGNPTPKALKAHRKMSGDLGIESLNGKK